MTRLGDVAHFVRGVTFKPADVLGDGSGVICLRTKNVQQELDLSDVLRIPSALVKRQDQYVVHGDLVVSSANSWNMVGKASWVDQPKEPMAIGGFIAVLRASSSELDPRYLYRWFTSDRIQQTVRSFGNQTTNISNLSLERCLAMDFPLPPLPEQRRIASILDQADALRAMRRRILEHLDELADGMFDTVFGDSTSKHSGFAIETLGAVTTKIGSGATPRGGKQAYLGGDFALIRSMNVHDNFFKDRDLAYIGDEQARRLDNVDVLEGDVLLNITGASVARVCLAPDHLLPARVNQHVAIIRPTGRLNPVFLARQLTTQGMKNRLLAIGNASGATRQAITKTDIEEFEVLVPAKELQDQFAGTIKNVDAVRGSTLKHLAQLDELFASLQQRAFSGQL